MKTARILPLLTAIFFSAGATGVALAQSPAEGPGTLTAAAVQPTLVCVPQLPGAVELVKAAAAQGMTVVKIEQTAEQVTAVYKMPDGRQMTVIYQPLPEEERAPAATTTVVYSRPAPVYYPTYYPTYYAGYGWPWYSPVALSIGLGFGYHHWR